MAKTKSTSTQKLHHPSAFLGLALLFPFLILNAIVANQIEPFISLIRPGMHTSNFEYFILFFSVLLIPVGTYIAIHPMLQKVEKGQQRYYLLNIMVAVALSMFFILLVASLGPEIYRCDILKIPNCD